MNISTGINETGLITAAKAARLLGLDHRNFLRLIRQGKVPATKVGGSWMVHPATIAAIRHKALIGRAVERVC